MEKYKYCLESEVHYHFCHGGYNNIETVEPVLVGDILIVDYQDESSLDIKRGEFKVLGRKYE